MCLEGGTAGEVEREVSRIQGNNFDIVTYEYETYCLDCGALGETGQFTVREPKEGYIDVDNRDGQSPSRWGT